MPATATATKTAKPPKPLDNFLDRLERNAVLAREDALTSYRALCSCLADDPAHEPDGAHLAEVLGILGLSINTLRDDVANIVAHRSLEASILADEAHNWQQVAEKATAAAKAAREEQVKQQGIAADARARISAKSHMAAEVNRLKASMWRTMGDPTATLNRLAGAKGPSVAVPGFGQQRQPGLPQGVF